MTAMDLISAERVLTFVSIVAFGGRCRERDHVVAVLRGSDERVAHDVGRRDGDRQDALADLDRNQLLEHEDAEGVLGRHVDRRRDGRTAVACPPLRSAQPTGF